MRRAALLVCVVAFAGCGGSPAPPLPIDHVTLPRPPLADALGKEAAIAQVASGDLTPLLDRLRSQPNLTFASITRDGITLRDVAIRRRGNHVAGEATVSQSQLEALAPGGLKLHYVPGGPGIGLAGSTKLLGASVPVKANVVAEDGQVVAEPQNLPVGRTVLFSDPRVHVDGLAARKLGGDDLRVRAVATLR